MIIPFLPAPLVAKCQNLLQCTEELTTSAVYLPSIQQQLSTGSSSLAKKYLASAELKKFNSFKYQKRRVEWLGGRIAAKEAFSKMFTEKPSWQDIIITPDNAGRPYISCGLTPLPDISISHSGDLAVAIAAKDKTCGVDIQNFTSTIIKVQERFALPGESKLIKHHTALPDQKSLTLLWTAKEALRKAFACNPLLGFQEITLSHFSGSLRAGFHGTFIITRDSFHNPQQVFLTLLPHCACSITVITS